jgi:hypothetical protein
MLSPLYKAVGTAVLVVSAFAPADAFVSSPASLSLKGKNAASISTRSIVMTPKSSVKNCNLLGGVRSLSAQAEAGAQEESLTVAMIGATGGVGRLTAAIVREQPSDPHHPRTEFLFVECKFCAKLAERIPTRLVWREGESSCQGSFKGQEAPGRCEHSISLFRAVLTITKAQLATSSSTVSRPGSAPNASISFPLSSSSSSSSSSYLLYLSIYLSIYLYVYTSFYPSPSLPPSLPPSSWFLSTPCEHSPLLSPIFMHAQLRGAKNNAGQGQNKRDHWALHMLAMAKSGFAL